MKNEDSNLAVMANGYTSTAPLITSTVFSEGQTNNGGSGGFNASLTLSASMNTFTSTNTGDELAQAVCFVAHASIDITRFEASLSMNQTYKNSADRYFINLYRTTNAFNNWSNTSHAGSATSDNSLRLVATSGQLGAGTSGTNVTHKAADNTFSVRPINGVESITAGMGLVLHFCYRVDHLAAATNKKTFTITSLPFKIQYKQVT
jgi:hypothetical protein